MPAASPEDPTPSRPQDPSGKLESGIGIWAVGPRVGTTQLHGVYIFYEPRHGKSMPRNATLNATTRVAHTSSGTNNPYSGKPEKAEECRQSSLRMRIRTNEPSLRRDIPMRSITVRDSDLLFRPDFTLP